MIGLPDTIGAVLFDLDGVLTGTADLHRAALYVDAAARQAGAATFREASDSQREQVVAGFMNAPAQGGVSDFRALFSEHERTRRLLRSDVLALMHRIYTHSGARWRARGYGNWIGVPGDPRAYTRPVTEPRC